MVQPKLLTQSSRVEIDGGIMTINQIRSIASQGTYKHSNLGNYIGDFDLATDQNCTPTHVLVPIYTWKCGRWRHMEISGLMGSRSFLHMAER